jgi:hypothetical protein
MMMMIRAFCVLTAAITILNAAENEAAVDIVRRSLELENRNRQRARDYTYQQSQTIRQTDGSGRVKSTKSRTHDVLILYGEPYMRLTAKDGKPLSPSEEKKQEQQLQKEMEKRRRQTEDPNSKEHHRWEKERAEQRKFLNEIPEAYDFEVVGEEDVSGQPAWVIAAEPRKDYKARVSDAKMFSKIRGKLWIDKSEYQWVKIEAETTDTISWGLFLARLARGSAFRFEQKRINDEVWLPSHAEISIQGRLALLKKLRAGVDITYSNYRKFQSESRVISTQAVP